MGERVDGVGLVVLEIVTSLAGPCEVFCNAFAASGKWGGVFIGECIRAIIFLAYAVFAATLRALFDQRPQFLGSRRLLMGDRFNA